MKFFIKSFVFLCYFFYVAAAQCSMEITFDKNNQTTLSDSQEKAFLNLLYEKEPRITAFFEGQREPMFFDILPGGSIELFADQQRDSAIRLSINTFADELIASFYLCSGQGAEIKLKLYDRT